jgi:ubiquinol-cytochrome c reductase cytochrome b subunit
LLMAIPYIDRNPSRLAKNRPFAIAWGIAWIFIVVALSFMGTPLYGIETPAATRIIQDLAPEEGEGPLRSIPYEELQQGVYVVGEDFGSDLCPGLAYQPEPDRDVNNVVVGCPHLTAVFKEFSDKLLAAEADGRLHEMSASLTVEQMQHNLVSVTPRVQWTDPETGSQKTFFHTYFLHQDRAREE